MLPGARIGEVKDAPFRRPMNSDRRLLASIHEAARRMG
jgi:hypothetical protein